MDLDQFMADYGKNLDIGKDRLRRKIALSDDVDHAICEEAQDYDLTVIGITNKPFMYRATYQTVPEALAQTIDKPLVMVKAKSGVSSMFKRFV